MKSFAKFTMPEARTIPTQRVWKGVLIAAALALVGVVFFLFDPVRNSFYPLCLFHNLTGLNCPGCGGLRALHHLTHGEILAAFHCNPLLMALLPIVAFLAFRWFKHGSGAFDGNTVFFRPAALCTLLAVTLAFTILRNLPWPAFAWMSP